jgi:hypothetical protein
MTGAASPIAWLVLIIFSQVTPMTITALNEIKAFGGILHSKLIVNYISETLRRLTPTIPIIPVVKDNIGFAI